MLAGHELCWVPHDSTRWGELALDSYILYKININIVYNTSILTLDNAHLVLELWDGSVLTPACCREQPYQVTVLSIVVTAYAVVGGCGFVQGWDQCMSGQSV